MAWYLNPALTTMRNEVNSRYVNRDEGSDGTIGDEEHQNTSSDHNPDSDGSVDAWDMDVEVNGKGKSYSSDVEFIKDQFEKHEASQYWIHNRKIANRDVNNWQVRDYDGANPHDKHVHFNTRSSKENSTKPWGIEDEMDQATFTKYYKNAQNDSSVSANDKARPWQYIGGGIPAGMSTLNVLEEVVLTVRRLEEDVKKLLEVPPGTVVVDEEQLEKVVREVIGSVDEVPSK